MFAASSFKNAETTEGSLDFFEGLPLGLKTNGTSCTRNSAKETVKRQNGFILRATTLADKFGLKTLGACEYRGSFAHSRVELFLKLRKHEN